MKLTLRIGAFFTFLLLIAGFIYYYLNFIEPKSFVNKFLEELEFKGVKFVDSDFFLSDYYFEPILTWEEYKSSEIDSSSKLSIEEEFEIWRDVYFGYFKDYDDIRITLPFPIILNDKKFREVYEKIEFSSVELKNIEINGENINAIGYANLKIKGNSYLETSIGGTQKWELLCRKGKYGWKVIHFALRI